MELPINYGDKVIDYIVGRLLLITDASTTDGKFRESKYRITVEEEPDSAIDGRVYVDLSALKPKPGGRHFGTGISTFMADVAIEVGFRRAGGDRSGDAKTISRRAVADTQKIADAVEDPRGNYDSEKTGIRVITFLPNGASRIVAAPGREVWAVRFSVEWDSAIYRR